MDHNVFNALLGLLGQFRVETNRPGVVIAASPLGLHVLQVESLNGNAHHRSPFGNQGGNLYFQLIPVPLGDNLPLLLFGGPWMHLQNQPSVQNLNRRSMPGADSCPATP